MADMREVGFPTGVSKTRLAELLAEKYPEHRWEKVYLLRGRFAQQKRLENALHQLFAGSDIKVNVRKEAGLLNPETQDYLELDFYIPALSLAFEFQERHHYMSAPYEFKPVEEIKRVDRMKRTLAASKGISLVIVPVWWDGRTDSLVASIKSVRPDLLAHVTTSGSPIPQEMPPHFFEQHAERIEDIGEPVTACFFTMSDVQPTGWWMFEKYDGVRGFWNPLKKAFYSRRGNRFNMPQDIVDSMPSDMFLDGELWFGRDNFQAALQISNRVPPREMDLKQFKYMVFDVPDNRGTYEQRYNLLEQRFDQTPHPYIELAGKVVCQDIGHMERFFQDVVDRGGEGVILRDPSAPYQAGRSAGYLKHKKFRDAEARIVRRVSPHQWECELPNGVRFVASAGTAEFAKRWDPTSGDIVSFKHHGFLLASKKPKLPALYRVRSDLRWEDVVNNTRSDSAAGRALRRSTKKKPKGYWADIDNRRRFFVKVAEELGFDPMDPKKWETVSNAQIRKSKGKALLSRYGTLKKALARTFHEHSIVAKGSVYSDSYCEVLTNRIEEQPQEVKTGPAVTESKPRGHWTNPENRRRFFCDFARQKGFDPTNTSAWARVRVEDILAVKDGYSVLGPYDKSLRKGLKDTFPELDFDLQGGHAYWSDPATCRKFFSKVAQDLDNNPLDVAAWRSVPLDGLRKRSSGRLIHLHNGGMRAALQKAYPELQFGWDIASDSGGKTCREFFDRVASEKGMNPLEPATWYSLELQQLKKLPKGGWIKNRHGGFKRALKLAYPELRFDRWIQH